MWSMAKLFIEPQLNYHFHMWRTQKPIEIENRKNDKNNNNNSNKTVAATDQFDFGKKKKNFRFTFWCCQLQLTRLCLTHTFFQHKIWWNLYTVFDNEACWTTPLYLAHFQFRDVIELFAKSDRTLMRPIQNIIISKACFRFVFRWQTKRIFVSVCLTKNSKSSFLALPLAQWKKNVILIATPIDSRRNILQREFCDYFDDIKNYDV